MTKKLFNQCKQYIGNYQCTIFPNQFAAIYILLLTILIISVIYLLINYFNNDYSGISYLPSTPVLYTMPLILMLNLLALYGIQISPFWAFYTWSYTTLILSSVVIGILVTSVQYTPFHYIDLSLIKIDDFFHFDTVALITFTHNHSLLGFILSIAYNFIAAELYLICIILPIFKNQARAIIVYFSALIISFLIGTTIYYFFPSVAPAHFFNSPYFTEDQRNTFIKFFQLHHYHTITSNRGGMIAFPSFHVIWAVLHMYVTRKVIFLFYPLVIINITGIIATLFLGWHYLIDVIGGVMLAMLSIFCAEWIFIKKDQVVRHEICSEPTFESA